MQKKSPHPRSVKSVGEFGLIRRIAQKNAKRSGQGDPAVLLGIGDDAAAVLPSPGNCLLTTTDVLLEKTHFDLTISSFFEIGYKALSVNISDIAAMGGTPRFYLVSLGLTGRESLLNIDQLYRGMDQAGHEACISLIGGNTTRSDARLFISITLLGEVPKDEMVTRSGARVGDSIYVTGTLGDSAAGLQILKTIFPNPPFRKLCLKHKMPTARWREGRLLAQNHIPSAMIDISDGLSSDLSHLAMASGVGAEIFWKNIPISATLKRYVSANMADMDYYVLHGGEEYELLFCVPESKRDPLEALIQTGAISAQCIGKVVAKKNGILLKGMDGEMHTGCDPCELNPLGYDHFRDRKR